MGYYNNDEKICKFTWCKACKHYTDSQDKSPCDDCLDYGGNFGTNKPTRYVRNDNSNTFEWGNGVGDIQAQTDLINLINNKVAPKANSSDVYDKETMDEELNKKANSSDVYGKFAIDTMMSSKADANDVYNKSSIDTMMSSKADANDVYNKSTIDSTLQQKANISDVYLKSQVDDLLDDKASYNDVYTKSQANQKYDEKADKATTYTKSQVDDFLNDKADKATTYTKSQIDGFLDDKANKSTTYTKSQVDGLVNAKQDKITDSALGRDIADSDYISNLDSNTNRNVKVTFSAVYNWLKGKFSTTINSQSTDNTTPTTKAVYDYIESTGKNYNELSNKPQINGVTLSGNKDGDDLDLVTKSTFLNTIMPKNFIIMTYTNINPSTYIGGRWELIETGYYPVATNKITIDEETERFLDEELPNIRGSITNLNARGSTSQSSNATGVFSDTVYGYNRNIGCSGVTGDVVIKLSFDARDSSSVYKNNGKVRPKSVRVYFWRRVDDGALTYNFKNISFNATDFTVDSETGQISLKNGLYYYTPNKLIIADESGKLISTNIDIDDLLSEINGKADANDVYTKTQVDDFLDNKADANDVYTKTQVDDFLDNKADANDVYTKTQVDDFLDNKADANDVYTKTQVDDFLDNKADANDVYTKTQVDDFLDNKADANDVYTKTQVDDFLDNKADANDVYTKTQVDDFLDNKADANDVYTKTQVDDFLDNKADANDVYTKTQVDDFLDNKADANDVYTKTQVDDFLDNKADANDVYTKTQVDDFLDNKADANDVYTKTQVDDFLDNKADANDVYTKTQVDDFLDNKADANDVYTKTQVDDFLDNKADKSTIYTKNEVYNKTEIDTELGNKQNTITDSDETSALTDNDKFSLVDSATSSNKKWKLLNIWNWIKGKFDTSITSSATNDTVPTSKATWDMVFSSVMNYSNMSSYDDIFTTMNVPNTSMKCGYITNFTPPQTAGASKAAGYIKAFNNNNEYKMIEFYPWDKGTRWTCIKNNGTWGNWIPDRKYRHIFTYYDTTSKKYPLCWFEVINNNPTYTLADFKTYLTNNGYTSQTKTYVQGGGGITGTITVTTPSGTSIAGSVFTGVYMDETKIKFKSNYSGWLTVVENKIGIETIEL